VKRLVVLLTSALCVLAAPVAAQDKYPSRPIRVLVPYAPGGAVDIVARIVLDQMREILGQTFVVENKPGAYGILAIQDMARARPDGYTLQFGNNNANVITPVLYAKKFAIDYERDVVPVARVADVPAFLIATKADFPPTTLAEFVAYAKQNPGKLSFGAGGGTGSSLYFATELLKSKTGITAATIPYRGAGPALNDLLGGHIDAMFDAMPVMANQVKAGAVTALAVTSPQRSSALPDVPTVMESGVPDYEIAGWFGILAPAGMAPATAQRLRDEVAKAVAAPDVIAQLDSQGMQPLASQPKEWHDYMLAELARYAKIIKDANIKPED